MNWTNDNNQMPHDTAIQALTKGCFAVVSTTVAVWTSVLPQVNAVLQTLALLAGLIATTLTIISLYRKM